MLYTYCAEKRKQINFEIAFVIFLLMRFVFYNEIFHFNASIYFWKITSFLCQIQRQISAHTYRILFSFLFWVEEWSVFQLFFIFKFIFLIMCEFLRKIDFFFIYFAFTYFICINRKITWIIDFIDLAQILNVDSFISSIIKFILILSVEWIK